MQGSDRPEGAEAVDRVERFWAADGPLARTLPGFERRAQQEAMARAVAEALDSGATLLVEAGTGTGKSLAYLVPAVFSGRKVVVSTGTKALQDQLAEHDLPIVEAALGASVSWCVMKGRQNYLCLLRHEQAEPSLLGGARATLEAITAWRETTETGDRAELAWMAEDDPIWASLSVSAEQCLGAACPRADPCFLTRMKRRAAAADVVIVNHALFFADLALGGHAAGSLLPHHTAIVFDEAHGLEEAAAAHWGVTISRARLLDLIADLRREPLPADPGSGQGPSAADAAAWHRTVDALSAAAERTCEALRRTTASTAGRVRWSPDGGPVDAGGAELLDRLAAVADQLGGWAASAEGWTRLGERIAGIGADVRFLWRAEDPSYVFWIEPGNNPRLTAAPLDVSALLRDALFSRETACVLTSATLAAGGGYAYIKSRLGIDAADELIVPSPFDYARQTLLYIAAHLPPPRDPAFATAAADEIVRLIAASRGRAFLLFTSRRMLDLAYGLCRSRLDYPLLKQGDAPRMALIERFKAHPSSVLFGTMGFWQGIDVAGEALSCVVLDKLPFAPPDDPLVEARLEALRRRGHDPFTAYQLPTAAMWLKQGMGRLIRSRSDRGVVAVLDSRLLTHRYGAFFLESLPPSPITTRLEDVERFFDRPAGADLQAAAHLVPSRDDGG